MKENPRKNIRNKIRVRVIERKSAKEYLSENILSRRITGVLKLSLFSRKSAKEYSK